LEYVKILFELINFLIISLGEFEPSPKEEKNDIKDQEKPAEEESDFNSEKSL
jgi:hypothetical protein